MDEQTPVPGSTEPTFITPFQSMPGTPPGESASEEQPLSTSHTLLKSLLYSALSLMPGLLIGITISLVLMSVVVVSLNSAISSYDFHTRANRLEPIAMAGGSYYWIPLILALISVGVSFFVYLEIFNPNFSPKSIKTLGVSYWRLILWFLLGELLIVILTGLLSYIHPSLSIISYGLLFWIIWHPSGLWGSFAQFKKDPDTRRGLFNRENLIRSGEWKSILVQGAIFSAWSTSLYALSVNTLGSLLVNAAGAGPETPWFGPEKFYSLLAIGFFGTAGTLPLLFALRNTKLSIKKRALRLAIPLIITLITIGLWKYTRYDLPNKYDYREDFVDLTGISSEELSQTVVEFEDGAPKLYTSITNFPIGTASLSKDAVSPWDIWKIKSDDELLENVSFPDVSPNCGSENIGKVESLGTFLENKDFQSALSRPYFEYLTGYTFGGCYGQNWEISKVMANRFLGFQKTNSIIEGLMVSAPRGGGFAQVKPEYISWADRIADDEAFYIGAGAARNIGDLYYHYGEIEKAKIWYQKSTERFLGAPVRSDFPPVFTDGYITGQLFFNDQPAEGVKIGLKVDNAFRSEEPGRKYNIGLGPNGDGGSGRYLVAVTTADKYGRFFFPKLIAGEYYLALLLPDGSFKIENSTYILENEFSKLTINETSPLISLGQMAFVETDFKIDESKLAEEYRDTDNDGLPDREESYYYADLNNPDTDSDGFSDGEELNRGFSPVEGGPAVYYPRDWNASAASQ